MPYRVVESDYLFDKRRYAMLRGVEVVHSLDVVIMHGVAGYGEVLPSTFSSCPGLRTASGWTFESKLCPEESLCIGSTLSQFFGG